MIEEIRVFFKRLSAACRTCPRVNVCGLVTGSGLLRSNRLHFERFNSIAEFYYLDLHSYPLEAAFNPMI